MNNNNKYNRMAGEYKQKMNPVTVSVAVREAPTATVEVTIAGTTKTTTTTTTTRGPEQTNNTRRKQRRLRFLYVSKQEREMDYGRNPGSGQYRYAGDNTDTLNTITNTHNTIKNITNFKKKNIPITTKSIRAAATCRASEECQREYDGSQSMKGERDLHPQYF